MNKVSKNCLADDPYFYRIYETSHKFANSKTLDKIFG